MEDDLNILRLEDDLKFPQLCFVVSWTIYNNVRKRVLIIRCLKKIYLEDDLKNGQLEDDFNFILISFKARLTIPIFVFKNEILEDDLIILRLEDDLKFLWISFDVSCTVSNNVRNTFFIGSYLNIKQQIGRQPQHFQVGRRHQFYLK